MIFERVTKVANKGFVREMLTVQEYFDVLCEDAKCNTFVISFRTTIGKVRHILQ